MRNKPERARTESTKIQRKIGRNMEAIKGLETNRELHSDKTEV